MVDYIFCECGKVVDEFEENCYWCKKVNKISEKEKKVDENERE